MKRIMIAILLSALISILSAPIALAKPDDNNPMSASDIELVQKITLKGKPVGKGKPVEQATTGELGDQCTGNKFAIVIGISDYPGDDRDLEYADDDADAAYNTLIYWYGYNPNNIYFLKDMAASYSSIKVAVDDIREREKVGDEVVFYFSGHGAKGRAMDSDSEKVDESIVCHDGNPDGEFMYIWDGELKDWFSGFDTTRIIFIFDSCLSGGMTDLSGNGRVINMACSENSSSFEGSWGGGHGQFTFYYIIEGMQQYKADKYNNIEDIPDVTVEEAFDYAKEKCIWQTPQIADKFENDLLP